MGKDQHELFESCREGDIGKVEALLCSRNRRPRTPLSFLKSSGSWVASCRDPNTGYTALHISALNGHPAIVRSLLSYHSQNFHPSSLLSIRDRRGCLPLHLAAWNGHLDVLVALLDPDLSSTTVNTLNNAKEAPLHLAAQHGHYRVTSQLLKRHADPTCRNARGETALDLAARFGRTTVSRLLIAHCPVLILSAAAEGKPPGSPSGSYPGTPMSTNSQSSSIGAPCSSLHLAARNGHLEIVKVLLDSGYDIDWITEEGSALHVAALFGKTPVVRYLLDRGISVHSRDWQGRTVLEVLEEHQGQRSMDLTQLIQNKDGWAECATLIKAKLTRGNAAGTPIKGKTLEAVISSAASKKKRQNPLSSRPPDPVPRYQNLEGNESRRAESKSPVWQPLPEVVTLPSQQARSRSALDSQGPVHTLDSYRPLSVQAVQARMEREESLDQDLASTISLTTSIQDPASLSPSAASTASSTGTFTALDEDTTTTLFHPIKPPRRRRKPPSTSLGSCPYQAPCGYETWAAPTPGNPLFNYDNVPSNMLVYDNAPPPGRKKWDHECQGEDGDSLQSGTPEPQGLPQSPETADQSIIEETIELITKSCTDMEGSLRTVEPGTVEIPPKSPGRVKFADTVDGRESETDPKAPLATPEVTEDLGGSTTEGEALDMSSSDHPTPGSDVSREEMSGGMERRDEEAPRQTPDDPPPSAWASESKIYEKIYPLGEELRRYSSASGGPVTPPESPSIKEQETQADGTSDSSGVCSENCSCGDGSSRQISPEKPSGSEVQCLEESQPPARKVQMRYGASLSSPRHLTGSTASPLDESAEWQKINDIMASFGGGICRESVFSERYEPRVAVFLKNRQSSALTLTMGKNTETPRNSAALLSPNSGLSPLSRWLKSLRLTFWADMARTMEVNGFDRIEFLKECLSRELLVEDLKFEDPEAWEKIMESAEELPDFPEKARLYSHKYVSDWLLSLGCQDYLGHFMKGGMDSVYKIRAAVWDMHRLHQMGIDSLGHGRRILASLRAGNCGTPVSVGDLWSSTGISTSDFEDSGALVASLGTYSNSETLPMDEVNGNGRVGCSGEEGSEEFVWKHDSSELVHGSIGYSAHYLGSTLVHVDNLEQSAAPIEAISKLKRRVREIAKIPQITMDISYKGVRLSDTVSKKKIGDHEIDHIRCVRQDERDLNCFAYITKDGERHFCHVFSVLTADVATEIILSLGQAFEVAYQLASKHP